MALCWDNFSELIQKLLQIFFETVHPSSVWSPWDQTFVQHASCRNECLYNRQKPTATVLSSDLSCLLRALGKNKNLVHLVEIHCH
jgi:hypothetical protein